MKTSDSEEFILEQFRLFRFSDILIYGNKIKCINLISSLRNYFRRKNWMNSSAKNAPPPDFYNDKTKTMMEVMKIDDHAFVDERGKIQNPTAEKESKLLQECFGKDYKKERQDITCYVVVSSGLPTKEDHNYRKYFANFQRVFEKHNSKIPNYKKNHFGYKTVFFVYDESSAYGECVNPTDATSEHKYGRIIKAKPHYPFLDKKFMNVIIQSDVDYVIWFMPWKMIKKSENKTLYFPKCVVIEKKKIKGKRLINYKEELMVSSEM